MRKNYGRNSRLGKRIRILTVLLLLVCGTALHSQNWEGKWSGPLTQDGKPDQFIYSIELEQEEGKVYGTATSKSANGASDAKFEIGGIWDGETLTLQEVKQLEPPNAKWCLKHIRLQPLLENGITQLKGNWEAEGCTPGSLVLKRQISGSFPAPLHSIGSSPTVHGKYTGHLSQSDRDYGFYFEIRLKEDGTGTSRIISDGEGGNATHLLKWTFDDSNQVLTFKESKVSKKSVAIWPWCIKSARMDFSKETNRLSLFGKWEGFIEGHDKKAGACAPGTLYLERPIFKKEEVAVVKKENSQAEKIVLTGVQDYEQEKKRDVQVDRVLLVKNETVRVRVWDNGVIDGDVLTLFVNGEMILENYRVTRRKHETIIKLDKPTNYLILHAINLGSISPNTVAVSVDDGIEEQVVIMSSNLDKSGAIMIRQFTVGKD